MADICERINWVNRKGQAIHRLCKLFGNFHSSAVLLCVCIYRKRATAEESLKHPWLNSLPHPHSHPHLHASSASSLDETETSQSESEPESPAPSPELDLIGSYLMCPGQGELKAGRDTFSFSEPPFPTLPEIQQELICWATLRGWKDWTNSNSTEQTLKASEPAASWPWSDSRPCYMDAVCLLLAVSTAVMPVSWAVCCLVPLCVFVCVQIIHVTSDGAEGMRQIKAQVERVGEDTQGLCRRTAQLP